MASLRKIIESARNPVTRRLVSVLILILAVERMHKRKREQPLIMATSREKTNPPQRLREQVLPWVEVATSLAAIAALFLTYTALQDSNAQLTLSRQQLSSARDAAQPSFQIKILDQTGNDCSHQEQCDPTRITIQRAGAAAGHVDYTVDELLLFSKDIYGSYYYLSPSLGNWAPNDDRTVWTLDGSRQLPNDLQNYDSDVLYVIDADYTDIFGSEQEQEWIFSNADGLIPLQGSALNKCNSNVLKSEFMSPNTSEFFQRMISSPYATNSLVFYSKRVKYRTLRDCYLG